MSKDNFDFFGLSSLFGLYDFKDKERSQSYYLQYMLNRTSRIFDYENLPETMPKRYLELYLQCNGHTAIIEHEDNIYCMFGGFGGEPDAYYMPTKYVIANPYLCINKVYDIGVNCVVIPNDSMYTGMLPLFKRYASLMVENDLTMRMYDINARISALIDAQDDRTRESALKYLEDLEKGENGVIASSSFFDGIRAQPYATVGKHGISELIEYQQYLKASWFNEIGLQANYNMKRESINSDEAQLNDDMLIPLIDDMYANRVKYIDEVNSMFGTDIKVKFSSAWLDNRIELKAEQKMMLSDYSEIEEPETEEIEERLDEIETLLESIEDELKVGEND